MFTNRQKAILELIEKRDRLTAREILDILKSDFDTLSKPTLLRDLSKMLSVGQIAKQGIGPNTQYITVNNNSLLEYIDVEKYFSKFPDQRSILEKFNWDIFGQLKNIFSDSELKELKELNDKYLTHRRSLSAVALKKELERLTIELSWKSSQLEGNTYSLIDTEILITKLRESPGHTKEEATMILNHKKAIDYILNIGDFKILSPAKIRQLHKIIIDDLGVPDDYRKILVGIVGTKFKPLDNQFQIKEAVDNVCLVINKENEPITKALLSAILIAYIQPFVDGNKRTGRLLTDAVLLASDWCPLSYRSIDDAQYKKAVLLFYEQNNLRLFKELFVEQFKFAVNNYFGN